MVECTSEAEGRVSTTDVVIIVLVLVIVVDVLDDGEQKRKGTVVPATV
jgi:hypothetical protein